MMNFIDEHRDVHGVEPICTVLQIAPSGYRRHAARLRDPDKRCARTKRDEALVPEIERVRHAICRSTAPTRSGINWSARAAQLRVARLRD
jgi:hypothetical protein